MGYDNKGDSSNMLPKDSEDNFYHCSSSYIETWKEMEIAVDLGLVRSIGVSNFNISQISQILNTCRIKVAQLFFKVNFIV